MRYQTLNTAIALVSLWVLLGSSEWAVASAANADVRVLLKKDAALADVGERIARAAAPLCPVITHGAGIVVQAISQYSESYRPIAARSLGIGAYPTVVHVVPGGSAQQSGLQAGDQIMAIDREPLPRRPVLENKAKETMADTVAALDALDRGLMDGRAELEVLRDGRIMRISVSGTVTCAVRFEVRPDESNNASAASRVVQVADNLVDPAKTATDLAPLVAHEVSHIALNHAESLREHQGGFLPGFGRGGKLLRASEIAADRLSVYLLAWAGYRPRDAIAFWTRFGRATDQGIFSDRTHPGWKTRVTAIQMEVVRIEAQRAAGQPVTLPADLAGLTTQKYR